MNAYIVTDGVYEQLIFAETGNKARYFAATKSWFGPLEYIETSCKRYPAGDAILRQEAQGPYWESNEKLCGSVGMKYRCFDCESIYPVGERCPNGC